MDDKCHLTEGYFSFEFQFIMTIFEEGINEYFMGYYKTIDGRQMDGKIIDLASLSSQGAGDGRISIKDAEAILKLVTDGNAITDVEKDSVEYLYKAFHWTDGAKEWFRRELQVWQSHKTPVRMTVSEISDKHFATTDIFTDPAAKAARRHALEAATSETGQDHDDIGLWIRLKDGTTVEVFSNFISLEGDFVELRGGCAVPVRAIEKVEI